MTEDVCMTILLVEDNPGDVVFFMEAVEAAAVAAKVDVATDGVAAMRYLRTKSGSTLDVMVLDLNLPVKTGRELLIEMKADQTLKRTPVAILTTSSSESAVCGCYTPGMCKFFTKTADFTKLVLIVKQIEEFARAVKGTPL